jgi:ADP-heptose:LPS heptosyltransferase
MKIFLKQFQSPGDILMLTSAVRDLKKSHPEFRINCKTSAQELW